MSENPASPDSWPAPTPPQPADAPPAEHDMLDDFLPPVAAPPSTASVVTPPDGFVPPTSPMPASISGWPVPGEQPPVSVDAPPAIDDFLPPVAAPPVAPPQVAASWPAPGEPVDTPAPPMGPEVPVEDWPSPNAPQPSPVQPQAGWPIPGNQPADNDPVVIIETSQAPWGPPGASVTDEPVPEPVAVPSPPTVMTPPGESVAEQYVATGPTDVPAYDDIPSVMAPSTGWTPPPGLDVDANAPTGVPQWAVDAATARDAAAALDGLFDDDRGTQRILGMLRDPEVYDVRVNSHDRIFYTDPSGPKMVTDRIFAGPAQYISFVNHLLALTDAGYTSVLEAPSSVIEGSFRADRTDLQGSLFIATGDVTRTEPSLVVRKQPKSLITLDRMLDQGMMSSDMRLFLELAVRGRANMLISGGSGAGKTTLARALSWFIDPSQRIVTVEEVDELHLRDRLPDVVALTTYRSADEWGTVRRSDSLEDLVRHALRMRADRIWVGETRGKEAYALVKSCLSGHDGSVTTLHANNAAQAVRQLVSYTMESHLTEEVARDQVAAAFHLAVQVSMVRLGRRVITEIVELEPVREGTEQRRNELWRYDHASDSFMRTGSPSTRLREALERHNVNLAELDALVGTVNWDA